MIIASWTQFHVEPMDRFTALHFILHTITISFHQTSAKLIIITIVQAPVKWLLHFTEKLVIVIMKWCSRLQWDNTEESHQKYYPSLTSNDHKNNFMIKLVIWYSAEPRLELVKLIESKRYLHMADTSFAYHCVAANWIFCGRLSVSAAAFGHPSLLFAFCKDLGVFARVCEY